MTAADPRCDGSLQLVGPWTIHARRAPCPVCGSMVEQLTIEGARVLVEHRSRQSEALPMSFNLA